MRATILILSFIAIIYCSVHENNYLAFRDKIIWGEKELTWNDFKGLSRPYYVARQYRDTTLQVAFYAYIDTKVISKIEYDPFNIVINSLMNPENSYASNLESANSYILEHEIYHFNIIELYARMLRKDIYFFKDSINVEVLKKLTEQQNDLADIFHLEYDSITDHSENKQTQKNWKSKIDSLMNKFADFENPNLSSYENFTPLF